MSIQPGQTILNNKYHIERLIGEGGMARVWLAEELTFGRRPVALKEPRDDLLPDLAQEVRLRYQREVQVCAALDKARVPNIVRAFTAEPYEDTVLLVMEHMPGGDLEALLKQHPEGLPVERAVRITLDLLAALEGVHAHELEIVHRDVKPSNILFDEQGRAHLADFGLAQLAGVSGRSQLAGGQHPGTPMYMAPEQARSLDMLLPAADLYAVGCVLFEMLTGKRYKRVRPGTIPSALRAGAPRWLDEIIAKALAEDPWERWHDTTEMSASVGEADEQARAQEAEEARRREEERARLQAAEEARRREAEERARAEAAEEARWREAEVRQPAPERRGAVSHAPRRAERRRPVKRAAWLWPAVGAAGVLTIAIAVGLWLVFGGGANGADTPTPESTQVAVGPTTTATVRGRIAFVSLRDGNMEIYVMNADGSEQTRLTNNRADDLFPAWSPDGSRIAFSSERDGNREIYVMNADGSAQTRLTDNEDPDDLPAWSPDGSRVAFSSNRDGNFEIYVMNADGSGQTRLTSNPAGDGSPAWSPDGSRIAFDSTRDGNDEIYVMNADGSGQARLTENPADDEFPAWSPDGERIAFNSDRDGNDGIYVMNADGSGQTRLTESKEGDHSPAWSPDGNHIAFWSWHADAGIYVVDASGSGLTHLTDGGGYPAWSP